MRSEVEVEAMDDDDDGDVLELGLDWCLMRT
jgi:hypothetical protein